MTTSDLVTRLIAHRNPDRGIHFFEDQVDLAYADLPGLVARMAKYLRSQDIRPGDAVALLASPSPEYVAALLATLAIGAVVIPLPDPDLFRRPQYRIEPMACLIDASEAHTVLVADQHADLARLLQRHRPHLRLAACAIPDDTTAQAEFEPPQIDSPAIIQFNSGPVCSPRGVVLSHRAIAAGAATAFQAVAAGPADRIAIWMPLSFDMGLIMLLGGLLLGADIHILRTSTLLHRPNIARDQLVRRGITVCSGPNFCYEKLSATDRSTLGPDALSSLRAAVVAGEVVDPDIIAAFTRTFASHGFARTAMTPAYGLAECTLMASCSPPGSGPISASFTRASIAAAGSRAIACEPLDDGARTLVSAGRPAPGMSLRIVADSRVLGPHEVGEIQVNGPSLMNGYTGDPTTSAAAFDGSWLRTGDLGFLHNGDLFISGRHKAMAIIGGRNIYASDIAALAATSTSPLEVVDAVLAEQGEDVIVTIAADPADLPLIEEELRRRCALVLGFRGVHLRAA